MGPEVKGQRKTPPRNARGSGVPAHATRRLGSWATKTRRGPPRKRFPAAPRSSTQRARPLAQALLAALVLPSASSSPLTQDFHRLLAIRRARLTFPHWGGWMAR